MLPTAPRQVAGFRYFNVYGPREQRKGRMASVARRHFGEIREFGKVKPANRAYGPGVRRYGEWLAGR